jgi:hypothetical protein
MATMGIKQEGGTEAPKSSIKPHSRAAAGDAQDHTI